jgi:hypothetical protein
MVLCTIEDLIGSEIVYPAAKLADSEKIRPLLNVSLDCDPQT